MIMVQSQMIVIVWLVLSFTVFVLDGAQVSALSTSNRWISWNVSSNKKSSSLVVYPFRSTRRNTLVRRRTSTSKCFAVCKDDEKELDCCTRRNYLKSLTNLALVNVGIVTSFSTVPSESLRANAMEVETDLPKSSTSSYTNNNLKHSNNNDDTTKEFSSIQEMQLWKKIHTIRRWNSGNSYTSDELEEMDALIDGLLSSAKGSTWQRDLLPGTWRVAYIRPGKEGGGGLDRRIPFPDLPFNQNYQIFTSNSVTNVGELLGPAVKVQVGGTLTEEDPVVNEIPKRFRADIKGGNLCAGNKCIQLPIQGVGLFDGVYLGKQIRIGQNLNGTGAMVVQVRCDPQQ